MHELVKSCALELPTEIPLDVMGLLARSDTLSILMLTSLVLLGPQRWEDLLVKDFD